MPARTAQTAVCMSNSRQVTTAATTYVYDNNGWYPRFMATLDNDPDLWKSYTHYWITLEQYFNDWDVLIDPARETVEENQRFPGRARHRNYTMVGHSYLFYDPRVISWGQGLRTRIDDVSIPSKSQLTKCIYYWRASDDLPGLYGESDLPNRTVVPVGGGSNVLGSHLAFSELLRRGEIDRLPRIFGVQAAHCAPVHAAFEAGANDPVPIAVKATVAEGIALRRPVRLREVVNALRATHGGTVAVAEEQILAAVGALARSGLFVEPTSAAAAAGLTRLFEEGEIKDGETTVGLLTGSGLKATESIGDALGLPGSAQ